MMPPYGVHPHLKMKAPIEKHPPPPPPPHWKLKHPEMKWFLEKAQ